MAKCNTIRARFYAGLEKNEMFAEDFSGQEIAALEDALYALLPSNKGYTETDVDTNFDIHYYSADGVRISFPEDWVSNFTGKSIPIKVKQYGLNPWNKHMFVKFELLVDA